MPAAAVIPAPIAYIKVVAVKKLVVGSQVEARGSFRDDTARPHLPPGSPSVLFAECPG